MKEELLVAAAVLRRDGRIMLAQRLAAAYHGGLWEFPGGKIEEGETPEEALRRELQEECEVDISVGALVAEVVHEHPRGRLRLLAYDCTVVAGEPRPVLCADLRWVKPEELHGYALAPADIVVADRIVAATARSGQT